MFAELLTICRGFITVSGSVILTNCRENRPVFLWEMLISIKSPLPPNYNGEGSGKVIRNLYPGPYHHQKLTSCAARSPPQYAPAPLWLWPFDLEVGVGVACDLGYLCAKFRLPRPFGFRVRADVRDIRQTDGWTTDADDRLMPPPPLRGRGHNKYFQLVGTIITPSFSEIGWLLLQ